MSGPSDSYRVLALENIKCCRNCKHVRASMCSLWTPADSTYGVICCFGVCDMFESWPEIEQARLEAVRRYQEQKRQGENLRPGE